MESRDGAVVISFASHECGLGSNPGLGVIMWVESVVGSRPCCVGFYRVLLPSEKPTFSNPNSIGNTRPQKLLARSTTVSKQS